MDLASVRMITDDLERVVRFYEQVTGTEAVRYTPVFAELILPSCTLAIGHTDTTQLFGADSARPADNHTAIIEFLTADVAADHARIRDTVDDLVAEPTTMPWGNRSLLFRDPDGNLANVFTPVTPGAVARSAP